MGVRVRGCLISVDGGGSLIKMTVDGGGWYGCIGSHFVELFLRATLKTWSLFWKQ